MKHFYSRILKSKVYENIKNAQNLMSIDLDKTENLCLPSEVDIGFSTKNALKSILKKVKETELMQFRMYCKKIILRICKKLKEKCPLAYKFVRGASCLSPYVMKMPKIAKQRVQVALEVFVKNKHFGKLVEEKIEREYVEFIEKETVKRELENFDEIKPKQRLDSFLMKLCRTENVSADFIDFIQRVLVNFYGNAAVECSFSFNKEFLVENLQENSLISQGSVHDFIINTENGNITKINITKDMISAFRGSSHNRTEALHKKKENESNEKQKKRKLQEEASILKLRKEEFKESITEAQKKIELYDKKIEEIEKKIRK